MLFFFASSNKKKNETELNTRCVCKNVVVANCTSLYCKVYCDGRRSVHGRSFIIKRDRGSVNAERVPSGYVHGSMV